MGFSRGVVKWHWHYRYPGGAEWEYNVAEEESGMFGISPFTAVVILWAAITTVLVGVLIYRALISMKEEDQLFLDPAQAGLEADQKKLLDRLNQIAPYTKGLSVASGTLLLVVAGLWMYQALNAPLIR